mmetsp:Transcript_28886/g.24255  ORF Transcript_28886/g.24255 Transcript_28886/m.24255 type:complete len:107 (+) Transcript_28886:735-1055(+)
MGIFDDSLSMFWDNIDTNKTIVLGEEGDLNIKCRMADGKSISRKFKGIDMVSEVYIWVHNYNVKNNTGCKKFTLKRSMPSQNYDNPFVTLNDVKLTNNSNLNVIKL